METWTWTVEESSILTGGDMTGGIANAKSEDRTIKLEATQDPGFEQTIDEYKQWMGEKGARLSSSLRGILRREDSDE